MEEEGVTWLRLTGVNSDVNVAMRAESVSFTSESVVMQSDGVLTAGIKLSSGEHPL
ncbi:hypothetical protein STW0522ENT62_06370 [Enterobacter kobei]|nr:hypothetical protein STW0522ENT62_06370 [Enterobacter kobei]